MGIERLVNRSYRLGMIVVAATVVAAAGVSLRVPPPRPARAAQDLRDKLPPLPAFALTERSGETVRDSDLSARVWVAAFTFTRCSSTCPRINTVMKGLQERFRDRAIQLVDISVDPTRDTPAVLARYAEGFGADPARWWFLTGDEPAVYTLIRDGFKLSVGPADPADPDAAMMEVAHSNRLALVDRGNRVAGLFNAEDPEEVSQLIARATRLDKAWVSRLPTVNASLNGLSTVLLLLALGAVLSGRTRLHIGLMIAALAVSAVFLACYLVYHAQIGGGVAYQGTGTIRAVYFTILVSHVVLAAAVVPLVLITVVRAIRGRYSKHVKIARVTFPIWLYVSITGVVVYLMLYQFPPEPAVPMAGEAVVAASP